VYELVGKKLLKTETKSRDSGDGGISLRRKLLEEIVNSKIYTDEGLDALFSRTRKLHSGAPQEEVEDAISYVLRELE
jgi:hypothetical protein